MTLVVPTSLAGADRDTARSICLVIQDARFEDPEGARLGFDVIVVLDMYGLPSYDCWKPRFCGARRRSLVLTQPMAVSPRREGPDRIVMTPTSPQLSRRASSSTWGAGRSRSPWSASPVASWAAPVLDEFLANRGETLTFYDNGGNAIRQIGTGTLKQSRASNLADERWFRWTSTSGADPHNAAPRRQRHARLRRARHLAVSTRNLRAHRRSRGGGTRRRGPRSSR